jgi:hypothetical protein
MFGSFDTDNFACVAADSGVHALQCKEQDFISRRSNQRMHWMCDKIFTLLHCMLRAFCPFHNTQRNNHDGNHRRKLLLISTPGILLDLPFRPGVRNHPRGGLLDNVIREVMHRSDMHICGVLDDIAH